MGKSKPRVRAKNRSNPTGKPAKPPADPELAAIREQRILPVLKDLQSPELKIRSSAARAITNIIEDEKFRKLLLREQIVKILLEQTLSDSNLETRTDGWGILRNLVLEEEADFCVHLYRLDILTAIEGITKTIIQTIESQETPVAKLPRAQQDLLWNLTSSIISLLGSLAEAENEILEAVSKLSTIVNFLPGLLLFQGTPSGVQNEVLSCLAILTEDNKEVAQQIANNIENLVSIKDAGSINSVAACGVLHNIFVTLRWFDHNTEIPGVSDAMLIPTLVQAMEIPCSKSNGNSGDVGRSNPDQVLQLALEITASIATSLQEALEHGGSHEKEFEGFGDDEATNGERDNTMEVEDEEDADQDDESGDGEMNDDEIEEDMEMVTGDGPDEEESPSEELTLNNLVRIATPRIIPLARPTGDESNPTQSYALSALNNIAWTISSIDFSTGHLNSLQKFWATLSQQIWNEIITPVLASNTADIELASAITSLAWAVSRSVKGTLKLQPDEPQKFMALYQASKSLGGVSSAQANGSNKAKEEETDAFQSLSVKCIGVLGTLALPPASIELNRSIGIFLLTILSPLSNPSSSQPSTSEVPPADAIEALNALFDIYADKSYAFDGPVFWSDNMYKHLEGVQPGLKRMTKAIDKRKFPELRERADEVSVNLGRFLVYKRKEKAGK